MTRTFSRVGVTLATVVASVLLLATGMALASGPAPVNLLSAGNFVILSKTGITNTGSHTSVITGNIGSSPVTAAAMNNVFCSEITGTIYGVDAAYVGSGSQTCFAGNPPLSNKTLVDNAVGDMFTAYTDAAGRTGPNTTELGAGDISGLTIAAGLHKWSTNVVINTDVTLSGGANDVWIFQIAGNLNIASGPSVPTGIKVVLSGGAQASNVFWQVGGVTGATLGTYSTFNGTILSAKQVILQTGAVLNGRALAQTQVVLDANPVSIPTTAGSCVATTQTIVSDTSNTVVGDSNAVAITPHPAWTASIPGATWIWKSAATAPDETVAFEKTFTVSGTALFAQLDIASDNSYKVFIDDVEVEADANATNFTLATQDTYNLTANVTPGTHTLRIEVTNIGTYNASGNPAGLLYKFTIVTCSSPPPPPANACSLSQAPAGFILRSGTSGNDIVTLSQNTMFKGNGGNDRVTGGDGNYIICTGSGSDVINLGNGDSTIDAGSGNNSVTVGNGTGLITSGSGSDSITTGDGARTINAGIGNNTIVTGNGNQVVTTGSGTDNITTGDGDDTINAGGGSNTVKAGAGNDTVTTGTGSDNIDGGADTDTCNAGSGINTVINCTP